MSLYGGITLAGHPDLSNIRKLDLLPMPALMEMQRYGFAINRERLYEISTQLASSMVELKRNVCSYIPESKLEEFISKSNLADDDVPMNVDSNVQLCELLFETLNIGKGHELKLTKSGKQISTGKKQLEKLKRNHPVIPLILNYKEQSKLKHAFADALPAKAKFHPIGNCWCGLKHDAETWRVHTTLLTTRTSSGRLASKDPNLQQISVRTELGRMIRAAFIASPGKKLLSVDWSQIEMRLGGHYSQDENLIRIFKLGLDPHTDTAKRAFKVDNPDKLTQRDPCKNVNFGVFYGLSATGLFDLMAVTYATAQIDMPDWLTIEWCDEFIKQWFELYPKVKDYLENQTYRSYRYGMVWTLFGRIRLVPEIKSAHKRIVAAGLRQAGNHPIQGTCADMMRLVLPEVQDFIVNEMRSQGIYCIPLLSVHDEGIWEVDEKYAEPFKEIVEGIFGTVLIDKDTGEDYCSVPIKASGKVMDRWEK